MKVKRNLAISESGFLFNPSTGDSFSVNPIGQDIIKGLTDGLSESEIQDSLFDKYDANKSTLEKDFYDFINQLKNYKLLENE